MAYLTLIMSDKSLRFICKEDICQETSGDCVDKRDGLDPYWVYDNNQLTERYPMIIIKENYESLTRAEKIELIRAHCPLTITSVIKEDSDYLEEYAVRIRHIVIPRPGHNLAEFYAVESNDDPVFDYDEYTFLESGCFVSLDEALDELDDLVSKIHDDVHRPVRGVAARNIPSKYPTSHPKVFQCMVGYRNVGVESLLETWVLRQIAKSRNQTLELYVMSEMAPEEFLEKIPECVMVVNSLTYYDGDQYLGNRDYGEEGFCDQEFSKTPGLLNYMLEFVPELDFNSGQIRLLRGVIDSFYDFTNNSPVHQGLMNISTNQTKIALLKGDNPLSYSMDNVDREVDAFMERLLAMPMFYPKGY